MRVITSRKGFTLIELTIVVTTIALLAALAIPNFMKMMAKSKQSEAKIMLGSIAAAQMRHKLHHGTFVACKKNPPEPNSEWDKDVPGWGEIGFAAHGKLLYQYEVVADEQGFIVYARANIDNDSAMDEWSISSEDLSLENLQDDVR